MSHNLITTDSMKCEIIVDLVNNILRDEPDLKDDTKDSLSNIKIFTTRIFRNLKKKELLVKSEIENRKD